MRREMPLPLPLLLPLALPLELKSCQLAKFVRRSAANIESFVRVSIDGLICIALPSFPHRRFAIC